MSDNYFIGLQGSPGVDVELEILRETEKAYFLKDELERQFWLPKSCFDIDGTLLPYGIDLYREKINE